MSSSYDKLRRILLLEREQSHRNRAVIGGLGRFLAFWAKEAREEAIAQPVSVEHVLETLAEYGNQSFGDRARAIQHILDAIGEGPQSPDVAAPSWPPADTQVSDLPQARDGQAERREAEEAPPEPVDAPQPSPDHPEGEWRIAAPPHEEAPQPIAAESGTVPAETSPASPEAGAPSLSDPVTTLKGVSTVNQRRLARLGIRTIRDMLYHLPRRYDDFGHLKTINRLELGEEVTVVGVVRSVRTQRTRSNMTIVRVTLTDGTGSIEGAWFQQPYLARRFRVGSELVFSGKVDQYLGRLLFSSPEWEPLQRDLLHTGRLVPVYPLTNGIGARWLRRLMKRTLDEWVPRIVDPLPESIQESAGLMDLRSALYQIHFPDDQASLERARERLCFDELFLLQLGILRQRQLWSSQPARVLDVPEEEIEGFVQGLPFDLTAAQRRATQDILHDLQQPAPMSRLLQGDVGSGKTVVALIAMLAVVHNGLQAAIMAPTAILAEQHYRTVTSLLHDQPGICCELLVGSLPAAAKERVQREVAAGAVQIIVGTHALIQEAVDYARLGLVVVDEQHRFGVRQRSALRDKGGDVHPHLLAMSATPIPRSLSLTLYGDLDLSVLDELPPGRQPVITAVRDHTSRERIYAFMRAQMEEGRQAFVICPLIEESESVEAKAAVAEYERLRKEIFPRLGIGLLHGRLSAADKEETMAAFQDGKYDLLVSTAVVEVGIDIPNANVILIEGAERFGLAQLHQFRGRVGRGEFQSYCILLSDDPSEASLERLRIMEETQDGFVLAEKDLALRGPGDFFGERQSGLPTLKVARLSDMAVLEKARHEAQALFASDPGLARPELRALRTSVRRFWAKADLS